MPAIAVKGAVIVVTVVAATCVAIYESPEVRHFAQDCRRRIAVALHSLGNEINPEQRSEYQPRFNRPEDADGFLQSSAEPGVDADEESKRRQREELMYWNRIRLEKLEKEKSQGEKESSSRGPIFDDFLHEDAEKGTFVYNSGVELLEDSEGLVRRRNEGSRGLDSGAVFANPFVDEHCIEREEELATDAGLMSPGNDEMSEDVYGLEEGYYAARNKIQTSSGLEHLVDISQHNHSVVGELAAEPVAMTAESGTDSNHPRDMTEDPSDRAFASIYAWADNSSRHDASFYSPLPVTPQAEDSEPEEGSGQATPTDSVSLAGSGEAIADNASSVNDNGRYYDVISEDGEAIHTPDSWTEVGSESDVDHQ